jgi:hypothetical protein
MIRNKKNKQLKTKDMKLSTIHLIAKNNTYDNFISIICQELGLPPTDKNNIDKLNKADVKILVDKTKPIEQRKQEFREKTFKYLDRYSESDLIEFFEDHTEIVHDDMMRFELPGYNIELLISMYFN